MNLPPFGTNPFEGVYNPAFPIPTGSIAGAFNGFGWIRALFNTGFEEFLGDMAYWDSYPQGVAH